MLDIKLVRDQAALVREVVRRRNLDQARVHVDALLALDEKWRDAQKRVDALRAERNALSNSIKGLAPAERVSAVERVKELKKELALLEESVEPLKAERDALLALMPNLLAADVPDGHTDDRGLPPTVSRRW